MGIEIVHHNRNAIGLGEALLNQFSHALGPGYSFMISPHIHPSPAIQRRIIHEQTCHSVALILTIIASQPGGLARWAGVLGLLLPIA